MSNRQQIIIGNWKMYKTVQETVAYINALAPQVKEAKSKVYLAVPFTAISEASKAAKSTSIVIGAQNMHDASEGAFTGEIAAKMLVEAGARFVILGHSERRRYFNETNELIQRKLKKAVQEKIQPILCIGETLKERQDNHTEQVLTTQLQECLAGMKADELKSLILAYEPVWAIGTDLSATPEEAQKAHQFCRDWFAQNVDQELADQLVIQYGGSVKTDNAKALLDQPDIDGLLVGGASLSVDTFVKIINQS